MFRKVKYGLLGILLSIATEALSQGDKRTVLARTPLKTTPKKEYMPGVLIVKFKQITSKEKISIASPEIQALKLSMGSIICAKQLYGHHKESEEDSFGLKRIVEIQFSSELSIEQTIKEIEQNQNVEYVECRYIYKQQARSGLTYIYKNNHIVHNYAYINSFSYTGPNDPKIGSQFLYLAQVGADKAWTLPLGPTTPTIIAILDSGVQFDHEDLASNIYYNIADPIDGKDNEGDGYIDNYRGWDYAGQHNATPTEDNDPSVHRSTNYHGIHVSGLASAVTNNNRGIASIAYNRAKLLIVKVGSDDDPHNVKNGYEAIVYAVNHGAKIINCSWGGSNAGLYGQNIINYAISRDCLIIAAAGNEDKSEVDYPAAYPGVLAVANVSISDIKASTSNYGRQIGISAPGEGIYSTVYGTYDVASGTSMATPIVSSAAALVMAKFPNLTMQQIADRLKASADNIDSKNDPAYRGLLGAGRLNVYRALTEDIPSQEIANKGLELMQNYPNPATSSTEIKFYVGSDGPTFLTLYSLSGQTVKELLSAYLYKGGYSMPVTVSDLSAGIYICTLYHGDKISSVKMLIDR